MKLKTLARLLIIFIKDKDWWREFIDYAVAQGYDEKDIDLLMEK